MGNVRRVDCLTAATVVTTTFLLFCAGIGLTSAQQSSATKPSGNSVTNIFSENRDPSDRLIVTPYIARGEIEKAQNLSRVTNFTRVHSYAGFFNVHPTYNSNMFFWFFPAAVSYIITIMLAFWGICKAWGANVVNSNVLITYFSVDRLVILKLHETNSYSL
jgi:hypothetical protein